MNQDAIFEDRQRSDKVLRTMLASALDGNQPGVVSLGRGCVRAQEKGASQSHGDRPLKGRPRPAARRSACYTRWLRHARQSGRLRFQRHHDLLKGQDGVGYQKDLGKGTATEAARLEEYIPDESWTAVQAL
ncbi:MAG: DUF2950 family protein [Verrucomicrobia bacterium]|nr:DUF2950 family protein [Verrucomicrobiota bacterium]